MFKKLEIDEKEIQKYDHLVGLMEQTEIETLEISAKQVGVLLSILLMVSFDGQNETNRCEPVKVYEEKNSVEKWNFSGHPNIARFLFFQKTFETDSKTFEDLIDGEIIWIKNSDCGEYIVCKTTTEIAVIHYENKKFVKKVRNQNYLLRIGVFVSNSTIFVCSDILKISFFYKDSMCNLYHITS